MTTLELVLNMLAEAATTEISKQKGPETFAENVVTDMIEGVASEEIDKPDADKWHLCKI